MLKHTVWGAKGQADTQFADFLVFSHTKFDD